MSCFIMTLFSASILVTSLGLLKTKHKSYIHFTNNAFNDWTYIPTAHSRMTRFARLHLQGTFVLRPKRWLITGQTKNRFEVLTGDGQSENWNGGNFQERVVIISIKTFMVGNCCQTARPIVDGLNAAQITKIIQTY